ncbi:MAG TPA: aminotransferase class V-fold PLP-dependent enzyme [Rhodothermales bacterium]|nr:aminotransferase class V-fold PLP-dependent enzyme [Rhodothermales bacterium]
MNTRRQFLKKVGRGTAALAAGPLLDGVRPATPWPPPTGVDDEDFWKQVRAQFPLTHERTYLNTGGLGPAPYPVLDVVQRTVMELQAICETGHHEIDESRAPVAAFFGVQPSEIAFMRNATEGNATVASGLLTMQAGDEVIFESHAHPGGAIPWMSRQQQQGIKVKIFEPDPTSAEGNLQRIADLITPRTRVIQISHVTAPTGIRLPAKAVADLAHEHGCWFHIDGAQSAGMITFDLKEIGCDSYATSGHKWMGAPHGTGVLYIREDRLDEVAPTEVGAYSDNGYSLPDEFSYNPTAQRYEPGTRDATKALGVAAAVAFLEQIGMQRVADYGQGLARYLQDQLRQIEGVTVLTPEDASLSGSITTFKTDTVPYDELYRFFGQEFQMRCRIVTERDINAVRVSTHIFNNKADCDRVVEATHAALKDAQ